MVKEAMNVYISLEQKDFLKQLIAEGYAETMSQAIRKLIDERIKERCKENENE